MIKNKLLIEGGGAGHMFHLYENGNLTFGDIKNIFTAAAEGKLDAKEKSDGQNIYVSVDASNNVLGVRGALSEDEIAAGGLSVDQVFEKLTSHENPDLKFAFRDAVNNFQKSINVLPQDKIKKIFGINFEKWFNCEVIDSRTPNVFKYDVNALVVHSVNHKRRDPKTNTLLKVGNDKDLVNSGKQLEKIIQKQKSEDLNDEYRVYVDAVVKLQPFSDKEILNSFLRRLDALLQETNSFTGASLGDSSSITDYMIARVGSIVNASLENEGVELGSSTRLLITKYILGIKINKSDLLKEIKRTAKIKKLVTKKVKKIDKDEAGQENVTFEVVKSYIRQDLKDLDKKSVNAKIKTISKKITTSMASKAIYKNSIRPLELIITDFAIKVLSGIESAFILNSAKEKSRLAKRLNYAIWRIKQTNDETKIGKLKQELEKLKGIDDKMAEFAPSTEGIVFDYNGLTYKFTGAFAPINQILGTVKYSMQDQTPDESLPDVFATTAQPTTKQLKGFKELDEAKKAETPKITETIAIVPGAFKPPHKGHLAMVKAYTKLADRVIIMMSPLSRELPDGTPVTFDISQKIWETYFESEKIDNVVSVIESPFSSPIRASFEFIANQTNNPEYAQPGQKIILGVSTKGGDQERFERDIKKFAREGVQVESKPVNPYGNLSATDMRAAIAAKDDKKVIKFLPDAIKNKTLIAKQIIHFFYNEENKQEPKLNENIIRDIINETITKRGGKFCLLSKKTKKNLGCFRSKRAAKKREKQVQYFKHINKEEMAVGQGAIHGYSRQLEQDTEQ